MPSSLAKTCFITADDWGLSCEINAGILECVQRKLVRRVSIMASLPHAAELARELQAIEGVETGLHFNLTEGRIDLEHLKSLRHKPLLAVQKEGVAHFTGSPFKIATLFMKNIAVKSQLQQEVTCHLSAQLNRMMSLGFRIDYVDSHQHVHALPFVFSAMVPVLQQYGIKKIRVPLDYDLLSTRHSVLIPAALVLKKMALKWGFEFLPFRYPQVDVFKDIDSLKTYLQRSQGYEVLVHPSQKDDQKSDGLERISQYQRLCELGTLV